MLTYEMLYAVLQGLPASQLDHLEQEWARLCSLIHRALKEGRDPLSALITAIQNMELWQMVRIKEHFLTIQPVLEMQGLSYRQKEALIALRTAKVASLAELSRVLLTDRSNTHKRLSALVRKGLALKFFRTGGVYYYALPSRLDTAVKRAVRRIMEELKRTLLSSKEVQLHMLADFGRSTTATTPTTRTTPTTPTCPTPPG